MRDPRDDEEVLTVRWRVDDVISAAEQQGLHLTREEANQWLATHKKGIEAVMKEQGNGVLYVCMEMFGI